MAMDVSTLSVRVESKGIDVTTKSLEGLEKRAATTESAVVSLMDKLSKSSSAVLSVVQSMNQLRAAMQGALPNNAISASLSDFKKMSDEVKNIQSMMGKGVGGNISVTIKEIGSSSKEAVKGVESLNQSLSSGQNVMQAFGKELYHIRNLLGGTMLAGALINAAQSAIKMADAWTLMGAKLKIQVGSAYAAADAQEKLYVMAQQLRVPLQGVTQLFTRLVPAMNEYGYSMKDAMSVTQAMAAALKVSGATAAEASSVMLQFSQSMQAGRLNGAEFNAVAEGAPIILRLIGQEINKTRGELKKMGADGIISVELITEVLKKNKDALTGMSAAVPDTVESAFTNLTNALTKYIGQANNAIGVTELIAAAIKLLAENLDLVGSVLKYVAIAGFAAYTASLTSSLIQMAIAPALSASLAAELGLVGTAATGAAGGVGILNSALLILARNPAIVIFTLLATGAAYVYDKFQQAEQSTKSFTNQLAELDKLKGSQAVQAYASAIDEVLDNLAKENNKLTELIEKRKKAYKFSDIMAYNDAIEDQKKAVTSLAEKYGVLAQRQADVNSGIALKRVSEAVKALQEEGKWLDYQIAQGKKLKDIDKTIFDLEAQIATAKDGFFKDGLKNQLIEVKANKARIDTLDNIDKASKKSSKEQESLAQKLEKSYLSALNSAEAFLESQQEELGLKRKLTESEKEYEKIMRTVSDLKSKFRGADVNELENIANRIKKLGEEKRARGELNAFLDKEQELKLQAIALEAQYADNQFKSVQALRDKINLQKLSNLDVPQTPLGTQLDSQQNDQERINFLQQQITLTATLIDLEVQKAYWEAYMANDSAGMARAEKAGEELQKRIDGYKNEIKLLQDLMPMQDKYSKQLAIASKKSFLDIGRSPGQILADGFGEAATAISKMASAYDAYGEEATKIDKYVADQKRMLMAKGPPNPSELAKLEKEAAGKRIQINAQMFGALTGAAKGFFSENSKGYQVMAKAEKAFHAIELAMATKAAVEKMALMSEELATKLFGITTTTAATQASVPIVAAAEGEMAAAAAPAAVLNAAQMPGPLAFAGAAAMIALIATLGVSMSGGATPDFKAERQAAAGTGSVFGDTGAKSESISKALENISANSEIANQYNEGMLNALKNIESSITGLAKITLRSGTQANVRDISGMGTFHNSNNNKLHDFGNILFSVKKSIVDSGILQKAQTLSEIMQGGANIRGYATIETKTKKWGKTKTKPEDVFTKLDDNLQKQFTDVIKGMASSITESAKVLNLDGADFTAALGNFVVDIGHISLHDLSGKQIQEQFDAIFSKMGDDMAKSALPMFERYQDAGEGYLETLLRVSSTVATVDGIFKNIGTTFGQVGLDGIEAKMHLVDLAGGLEKLSGLVSDFFGNFYTEAEQKATLVANVSQKLISLGITDLDVTAKDGRMAFRKIVEQYKDTNSDVFIELLKLQESVSKIAPAFEDEAAKNEKVAEALAKQQELKDKLATLEGKGKEIEARKRQEELGAMDATSKAIQLRIWELEDEKVAIEAAKKDEISSLNQQISVQQDYVSSLKTSADGINNLIGNIDSLASSGMAMLGMTPKVKSLVENFNSTDESVRSLSETLNKFTATTVLSLSDRLTNLVEQDKAILDFQSNLKDMIGNLRFESLSLEDRISSLKTLEGKLFGEINGADNPLEVAKHLQEVITQRYSLEQEYQAGLLAGQKEINETTKSNLKQQIDSLHSTKDFLTSLKAFTASIKIGELSILSPEKQLGEASQQFYETLAKAKTGDTQAQADLTNLAKSLLDEAKGFYASTTGYVDIYNQVTSALGSFGDMANIDPQITLLEKQLSTLDALAAATDSLKEQQIADLERVSDTLNNAHIDNKAKQQELIDALKVQISELKNVQENQIAQIKQQLAIRDESNIKLDEANGKLSSMRDSLKLLERK